jgi:hypothetical protein
MEKYGIETARRRRFTPLPDVEDSARRRTLLMTFTLGVEAEVVMGILIGISAEYVPCASSPNSTSTVGSPYGVDT